MSKFNVMNDLEIRREPQRLMTLSELISITQRAMAHTSIRAVYNGRTRCIVPNFKIEKDAHGNEILALRASRDGFVLIVRDLRSIVDLHNNSVNNILISVQWRGAGILYVRGIDLNDHSIPGIYLALTKAVES